MGVGSEAVVNSVGRSVGDINVGYTSLSQGPARDVERCKVYCAPRWDEDEAGEMKHSNGRAEQAGNKWLI